MGVPSALASLARLGGLGRGCGRANDQRNLRRMLTMKGAMLQGAVNIQTAAQTTTRSVSLRER